MAQFSEVQHGKQTYFSKASQEDKHGAFIPTPEQIKQGCAEAQATWSDYEREQRKVYLVEPVVIHRTYESNLGQSGAYRRRYSVEGSR